MPLTASLAFVPSADATAYADNAVVRGYAERVGWHLAPGNLRPQATLTCPMTGMVVANGPIGPYFIDPVTIIALIGLIVNLVRLWKECRETPEQAATWARDLGVWGRWRLRGVVRRAMTVEGYAAYGRDVRGALEGFATGLMAEDVRNLYRAVA